MIKFENVVLPSAEQWMAIILGARNPMNSWERSDSCFGECVNRERKSSCPKMMSCEIADDNNYHIGPNDQDLMKRLAAGGSVHAKYRRMITVYVDVTAPLYWWKEFDTYKVGVVANSCSTMHKIAAKEFMLKDFSTEHLISREKPLYEGSGDAVEPPNAIWLMNRTIQTLNQYRELYLETKDKKYWWQMIQLLPSSYNQKRTVMCNYETLTNIYKSRKDHKLDEWKTFCNDWIKNLPYSDLITGEDENEKR